MNEPVEAASVGVTFPFSGPQGHLQRIERQRCRHRGRGAPADDAAAEHVGDERGERHPRPGRDVGEVHDPQPVRLARVELAPHQVRRPGCRQVRSGGAEQSTPAGTLQPSGSHQPLDLAARDRQTLDTTLAQQLRVHLANSVEATAELGFGVDPHDLGQHPLIAHRAGGRRPELVRPVAVRGDLDPVL